MSHANKIMGAVVVVTALVTALLLLAGVITTDAYSRAAQATASGDLALMQLTINGISSSQGNNSASQFTDMHQSQDVNQ